MPLRSMYYTECYMLQAQHVAVRHEKIVGNIDLKHHASGYPVFLYPGFFAQEELLYTAHSSDIVGDHSLSCRLFQGMP